jgi:GntR family transcriptional regulator, transcriptional repressor for pyruvate dehydrogenase complex
MPDFKPVKQSRLSDAVTEQLKQSILRGEFEPGAKLPPERLLADQFGVSRLSIREALHRLEILGFVIKRPGAAGGVFVIDLTFQSLANGFSDLFLAGKVSVPELRQLRVFLEPEVARLATIALTKEHARRLEEAYRAEEARTALSLDNFDKRSAVHRILAHMCGNRFYEAIVRSTMELTYQLLAIVDLDHEDFDLYHPTAAHGPVVEAVLSGDSEKAFAAMKTHAIEFGDVLLRLEEVYRRKMREPTSRVAGRAPEGLTR